MPVIREVFGRLPDGREADLFVLNNRCGMEVRLTAYGALVTSLRVPDRTGRPADVVLGYDTLEEYLRFTPYFGATIGRFAGPLREARFTLDGVEYPLAANEGRHHLHGGRRGFDKVLWWAEPFEAGDEAGVRLNYTSPDGEEGYPGRLSVNLIGRLTADNALDFDYVATTDRPTMINLTHHGYFNLAGQGCGDIQDHVVELRADRYHLIDGDLVPTGEVAPVAGTPLDLNRPVRLGDRLRADHEQVRRAGGFDQNWLFDGADGTLRTVARVTEPSSGRILEMATTEPGCQLYTSNILPEGTRGKEGRTYGRWSAFCLEAQRFPPRPDSPAWCPYILRPGERYHQRTVYRFRAE